MKTCSIKFRVSPFLPTHPKITPKFSHITCSYNTNNARHSDNISTASANLKLKHVEKKKPHKTAENNNFVKLRKSLVVGGAVGLALLLMTENAWAFGPEGPLVEEFWENVRRYGLYALTVSTGVLYAVFQPIYELLKNPISAVLVIVILGGSFFIISQVLSAMVGVSDFSYQYAY